MKQEQIELVRLLTTDFSSAEKRKEQEEAEKERGSLKWLVANAFVPEHVEKRSQSLECRQLVERAGDLLTSAPISVSFKRYIITKIQDAYSYENKVSVDVAPSRLGLDNNSGIYEDALAPEIEARILRNFLFNFLSKNIIGFDENKVGLLFTMVNTDEIEVIENWVADYLQFHKQDPFGGKNMDLSWAKKGDIVDIDSDEGKIWRNFFDNLDR